MPNAAPRFSLFNKRERKAWEQSVGAPKRLITGRALQRERARLFAEEPLCRECNRWGMVTAATIRDHIIPLAEGGKDVRENTQPLCVECHDAKSRSEAKRAPRSKVYG